jgi:outer membrane lipoprotein-sorting protein
MVLRPFTLLLCAWVALGAAPQQTSQDELLARMSQLNPGLHSYTATLKAHVVLTTFPFLTTDLVGTYYHKDPDHDKLVITSGLPGIAAQFSKFYPHIEPASRWDEFFVVTKVGDDGTVTTYRLVPRKRGNIDHIDVRVDDRTATVASMRWNYYNGGWVSMSDSYGNVQGNVVVTSQTAEVNEPGYRGNINSTLSDYSLNPRLSDAIFTQQ